MLYTKPTGTTNISGLYSTGLYTSPLYTQVASNQHVIYTTANTGVSIIYTTT